MKTAPIPPNEADRLAALDRYDILDTPPDAVIDGIAHATSSLCDTPIALVSLVDPTRQWFKACIGLSVTQAPREHAFCAYAILNPTELMEVEDASQDDRFFDNPLVTGKPKIRFYASKPLVTDDGYALGTLCVIDTKPRRLTAKQRDGLSRLAQVVMGLIEERRGSNTPTIPYAVEQTERHGVLISDPRQADNPVIYVNRAFERITGYNRAELIGRNCRFLQGPDTDAIAVSQLREAITAQQPTTVILKNYRKDGTMFWNELTVSPVKDRMGNTINFVGIQYDVTDRQLAQEQAAELSKMIGLRDRAIEALDVGVTITDATKDNHPLVYFNEALCNMTGYSREELLGHGVRILQKNDNKQPEHKKIEDAQALGKPVHVLFKSTRKDGTQYMDELSLSPIHNQAGQLTHYIGINRDVTQKIETEARLHHAQKIEAIGQLSGGIAHDFNNLLNVITGNLEFLSMGDLSKIDRDYLDEANNAAEMGARLTRRLLKFSRQSQLEPEVLNANDYVLNALELLRSTIGETIMLSSNFDPDLWTIRVDPSEIENAIVNLAINSRDAMPNGGKIKFDTKNVSFTADDIEGSFGLTPGDYIRISVTDNGCGMTDEVKARIFEPFFTTKESNKGTGLGLASIHGFVNQSGGHVHVYSEEELGTTINLYLPRYCKSSKPVETMRTAKNDANNNHIRVLVVEDSDMVRKVTLMRLQALGYSTEEVSSGPEAIQLLENDPHFDLVLSDVVMEGGMSGFEVARWVQNNLPACKMMLTSGFNEQMAEDNDVLTQEIEVLQKPYSLAELERAVANNLANKLENA